MTGEEMNPHGYALALPSETDTPLPVRAAFLRRVEPHPGQVREVALKAHVTGPGSGGRLTAKGERDALEVLRGVGIPPRSIDGPTVGQEVHHEP
ncbi:hypothetical protein [Deinococcus sp. YIM 77859]|uniref:hypothetical protein n=1 Tax=Deinococcus sp. YIM 77859 TaxID=1540221 RepID=UPI00055132B2|nr:hypothetical protein [Deinococcus sp. YIM 77859]